jgi:hypothetical protein
MSKQRELEDCFKLVHINVTNHMARLTCLSNQAV